MYSLTPARVYIHRRVYRNPRAVARLERMLGALGNPATEDIGDEDAERVLTESGPAAGLPVTTHGVAQGVERRRTDPAILFNTFEWDPSLRSDPGGETRSGWHRRLARVIRGAGEDFAFSRRGPNWGTPDGRIICEGGWGIHTLTGCVHKCDYCAEAYIVNVMLDLEDFAAHLAAMLDRRPEQTVYRYDVMSDTICFEPEYGASAILAETFARSGDKYLMFYTKSDNVEHLLDLPKSNSIFYCTLSAETTARAIERDTPPPDRRLEALRRCRDAGYPIRVGFSPIIPTHGWREEATDILERLFATVSPEVIRLWVISLMRGADFERAIDPALIEPRFLDALRAAGPSLDNGLAVEKPFPRHVRREIYAHYLDEIRRISPRTPVGLCSEERVLWDDLANRLPMTPDSLFCCCGGVSPPGGRHSGERSPSR